MRLSRQPNRFITVGLIALAAASVSRYLLERKLDVAESISDPVVGFLYGVAIAAMLVGIRRQVKANAASR